MSQRPSPITLVLASRNQGKIREIKQTLGRPNVRVVGLNEIDPVEAIPEPPETGATFAENAHEKAHYYARATGHWALADDSGLVVDALNGAPGVHSARYAAEQCPPGATRAVIDQANNRKLLANLANVPDERRTARFVCHLALSDGREILLETDGVVEGQIGHAPAGENGFGYDPLFYIPQAGCTTAQLPADAKNAISHRGQAVREFQRKLEALLEQMG